MKNFVEFLTSNIFSNFIFEFAEAYESHVQKLIICSLKFFNCMVTKSIYIHSTCKFYTQPIIIEYKKLLNAIYKTSWEICPWETAKNGILYRTISSKSILSPPHQENMNLVYNTRNQKNNHLGMAGLVKWPFCPLLGPTCHHLSHVYSSLFPSHLSPWWPRCGWSAVATAHLRWQQSQATGTGGDDTSPAAMTVGLVQEALTHLLAGHGRVVMVRSSSGAAQGGRWRGVRAAQLAATVVLGSTSAMPTWRSHGGSRA